MSAWNIAPKAEKFHRDALVWDNIFPFFDLYFFSGSMTGAQAGLFDPKYKSLRTYADAGCDVIGLTVAGSKTGLTHTMRIIANNLGFLRANADKYVLAKTADDILNAKRDGKVAVVFNFQGSDSLEWELDTIALYYELGVRQMLLCYNTRNSAGNGCHEPNDDGLSEFGKAVVKEMNRVGMVVDASHTGYRTTMDMFEVSTAPVIFSHSNPAKLQAHPRNVTDDQIKACAQSGGVIGVVGFDGFLPGKRPSVPSLVEAIDYLADKAGIDHVGLGLDWIYCEDMFRQALAANTSAYPQGEDGHYSTPAQFLSPAELPQITTALMERGYREEDLRKILGGNWLRIAREVWK